MILPGCWADPCKTSGAGVQVVDIRHWNLGCAMTFGAPIAAVAPAAATTPPAFTRNLRRSIRSPFTVRSDVGPGARIAHHRRQPGYRSGAQSADATVQAKSDAAARPSMAEARTS